MLTDDSGGRDSAAGDGGSGGEGGNARGGNGGTSGGLTDAAGASGAAIAEASADRDASSGAGGRIGGDATSDGRDGASGTGGTSTGDGSSGDTIDTDGASDDVGHGGGGAGGGGGASGSGGAGGMDAAIDSADGADGNDGEHGSDAPPTCGSHPLPPKTAWVVTASHTSLGNSQESDPLYNPTSHAHDGNVSERWSTGKPQAGNEWLQVDFGRRVAMRQVTLQIGTSSSDHPRGYAARVSETPLDFASPVLVSGAGQPSVDTVIVFDPGVVGRYLSISQTGSASSWWSVAEVNVACSD